jgi:hypothetical protein
MKKILLCAMSAVLLTVACKKEEVIEEISNDNGTTFKATVNGKEVSMPIAVYYYSEILGIKNLGVASSNINNQSISMSANITNKGDIGSMNTAQDAFLYQKSASDSVLVSINGNLFISKWDTVNERVSGTFSFDVLDDQDTIHIENGVFTNLPSVE